MYISLSIVVKKRNIFNINNIQSSFIIINGLMSHYENPLVISLALILNNDDTQ